MKKRLQPCFRKELIVTLVLISIICIPHFNNCILTASSFEETALPFSSSTESQTNNSSGKEGCSKNFSVNKNCEDCSDTNINSTLTSPQGQHGLGWQKHKEKISAAARVRPEKKMALSLPATLDWRNKTGINWTTPIRDQGGCGSCVAFGTIAAFEAMLRITSNNPSWNIDLSEQHIFSCGGGLCSSGWTITQALNYIRDYGAPPESCFPYQGKDLNCSRSCSNWQSLAYNVTSWNWLYNDVNSIQTALQSGPVVGAIEVYSDFFSYSGGVYRHTSGDYVGGHAITIVGYNNTGGYWICKNSWGTWWGEKGWFRIAFGECEIEYSTAVLNISSSSVQPSNFTLDFKTDSTGVAWASGTYLVSSKVNQSWSSGPHGDQSTVSTVFTPTAESLTITLGAGENLLLIGTSQLWNNNPLVGSSVCITRDGNGRISGDMFTVGANLNHRHPATVIAVDKPGAGTYTYRLKFKTDPGGESWVSGTYLLAIKIDQSWSHGPNGDQSTVSTVFTPTAESLTITLGAGENLLLIGTSQLWNNNPLVGSSICITRSGLGRISGDMFTAGAGSTHRHLATALAIDSPGQGTFVYTLAFKTDAGGTAWTSGTYLIAVKTSSSSSSGPTGDQSTASTSFTTTAESISPEYLSGDKLLLISTSQCWNSKVTVGSSICISQDNNRISSDMFALGATSTHRHLATAIAIWTAP